MPRIRKEPSQRESAKLEPEKIFLLAVEGEITEVDYFIGIQENKNFLKIPNRINIKILKRIQEEKSNSNPKKIIKQLNTYCNNEGYRNEEVCMIVDRDEQSFPSKNYDTILEECDKKNYNLFVTNPCFEFWILMHFDMDLSTDYIKKIKENRKEGKTRFLSKEVGKKLNRSAKRKNLDFRLLRDKIDKALDNSKNFEKDLFKLKTEIGTNLSELIEKILM